AGAAIITSSTSFSIISAPPWGPRPKAPKKIPKTAHKAHHNVSRHWSRKSVDRSGLCGPPVAVGRADDQPAPLSGLVTLRHRFLADGRELRSASFGAWLARADGRGHI